VQCATASLADVPDGDAWLGPREREVLARLDGDRRRAEWRLGRWAAKRLVGGAEILPAADGAPEAGGAPLSIAHRRGRALAAWDEGRPVGCDLEPLREDRDVRPHVAWEAAAKALRRPLLHGERPDVELRGATFAVRWPDGAEAHGRWWIEDGWVMAVTQAGEIRVKV
jgi:4'-phosphopantetheinyl transferase EntD